jgi:hypothetical protein
VESRFRGKADIEIKGRHVRLCPKRSCLAVLNYYVLPVNDRLALSELFARPQHNPTATIKNIAITPKYLSLCRTDKCGRIWVTVHCSAESFQSGLFSRIGLNSAMITSKVISTRWTARCLSEIAHSEPTVAA